jgi:hypothetical protein
MVYGAVSPAALPAKLLHHSHMWLNFGQAVPYVVDVN